MTDTISNFLGWSEKLADKLMDRWPDEIITEQWLRWLDKVLEERKESADERPDPLGDND